MAEKSDTSQSIATLLRVVAALVSGEMIRTTTHPDGFSVIAVMRDDEPKAPTYVRLATRFGLRLVLLDEIELIDTGRVEVGADGCGCPITEEILAGGSSVEDTERTEHVAGCWNAPTSNH